MIEKRISKNPFLYIIYDNLTFIKFANLYCVTSDSLKPKSIISTGYDENISL